ncbi:MAG: TetR/AcrR family transcriptional regulator [Nitrospirota bacterium]
MELHDNKKREMILNSALELFSKRPFHRVTMEDIANKADVAKGTVYYHFDSKNKLFEYLITDGLNSIRSRLDTGLKGDDPVEDLRCFIESFLNCFIGEQDFFSVLQYEELKDPGDIRTKYRKKNRDYCESLTKILDDGMRMGKFRKDIEPNVLARMIIGMIKSVKNTDHKDVSSLINDMILNGITKGG